ncbi:MAG: redox-regulated ATPase YchF [Candidatus Dojkabacteria bacterium]|nr:redox-regulated ATPase YchF [Candidatus Dojkabacteria bacterium]
MKLSVGIIGLPNVGKSTLFNAITNSNVLVANYPFSTIDPNIGIVNISDYRLDMIAKISNSKRIVPATIEFIDIAGLVRGASKGEGLGNKFLSYIREVSLILHVVRGFSNDKIVRIEHGVNIKRDIELVNTELILKDIETVEKKIDTLKNKSKSDKSINNIIVDLENLLIFLKSGNLAKNFTNFTNHNSQDIINNLFLLTNKPVIYLINMDNNKKTTKEIVDIVNSIDMNASVIFMNVLDEYMISKLDIQSKQELTNEFEIKETGTELLIKHAYSKLDLISFFTFNTEETRAWTIKNNTTAIEASRKIHSEFEKNFIAMEVVSFENFVKYNGWNKAKEQGKLQLVGKEYIVKDGDIVYIKHNAK